MDEKTENNQEDYYDDEIIDLDNKKPSKIKEWQVEYYITTFINDFLQSTTSFSNNYKYFLTNPSEYNKKLDSIINNNITNEKDNKISTNEMDKLIDSLIDNSENYLSNDDNNMINDNNDNINHNCNNIKNDEGDKENNNFVNNNNNNNKNNDIYENVNIKKIFICPPKFRPQFILRNYLREELNKTSDNNITQE